MASASSEITQKKQRAAGTDVSISSQSEVNKSMFGNGPYAIDTAVKQEL